MHANEGVSARCSDQERIVTVEVSRLLQFRITKYDPGQRNASGHYLRREWTSVGDIGRSFDGIVLTEAEYERIETAYMETAVAFLRGAGVSSLVVAGLENHADVQVSFADGDSLNLAEVKDAVGRVLREEFWCRFEGQTAFIHIGYDYYMYVGVPHSVPEAGHWRDDLGYLLKRLSHRIACVAELNPRVS